MEKLKRKEITITKSRKKTEKKKNRKGVPISVKSVRRGARYLWKVGFEKKKLLRLARKNDGVMNDTSGDDDTREAR